MQTLGIHSDSLSNIIQVEQDLAEKQEKIEKQHSATFRKNFKLYMALEKQGTPSEFKIGLIILVLRAVGFILKKIIGRSK